MAHLFGCVRGTPIVPWLWLEEEKARFSYCPNYWCTCFKGRWSFLISSILRLLSTTVYKNMVSAMNFGLLRYTTLPAMTIKWTAERYNVVSYPSLRGYTLLLLQSLSTIGWSIFVLSLVFALMSIIVSTICCWLIVLGSVLLILWSLSGRRQLPGFWHR